jgi:hypothetical protein
MRPLGLVDFSAANPRRAVDWRWRKAGYLLDRGLRWSRRRDDELTRIAKQYQAGLRRCRGEADRRRLARRMPDIGAAVAIHDGEPTARLAVETRLLAGEPSEAIARRCGVPVEVAEVYEQLFFNVADRLTSTSYILFHAIGAASYRGFDGDDRGAVLKWFAYMGGPVVLDALIDRVYGSPDRPEDERFLDELRLKLAVAIKLLPIDATTAPKLIRLYLRLRQAELAAEGFAGPRWMLWRTSAPCSPTCLGFSRTAGRRPPPWGSKGRRGALRPMWTLDELAPEELGRCRPPEGQPSY